MSRRHGGRFHRAPAHARRDVARNATTDRPSGERGAPPPLSAVRPEAEAPDVEPIELMPASGSPAASNGHAPELVVADPAHATAPDQAGPEPSRPERGELAGSGCTAPQLRRFIKSRAYVPMHELRRRFGINGVEDDVTPIDVGPERVFVGLPARESALLGELFRAGDIGYELSLDPCTPVVIGVYPMRPVPRG